MLRCKKDVDRHVRDILAKIKSEDERKARGYVIARLYYNIGEYESSRRYLNEFLAIKPKAIDAHKLLGQIYEKLGKKDKAIIAYKAAYELGKGEKDIILKICELYTDVPCDNAIRLYWAEEGQRVSPHDPVIIKLRETLLFDNSSNSKEDLEKLYIEEIKANPISSQLQVSLLRLYEEWGETDPGKLKEAYNHGTQVEARRPFYNVLEWYQSLLSVIENYEKVCKIPHDYEFLVNYLSVLERLLYLSLAASNGAPHCSQFSSTQLAALINKFDQKLHSALKVIDLNSTFGQLMMGQLYFYMTIFILQNCEKEGIFNYNSIVGALLFHACRFQPASSSNQVASETNREHLWYRMACHRISQAGHVLDRLSNGNKNKYLDKVKQHCSNNETQMNVYNQVFSCEAASNNKSAFLNDKEFVSATLFYPDSDQLSQCDQVSSVLHCSDLRYLVWLCLQETTNNTDGCQPYYNYELFEGLQFSTPHLNTGAPETLSHLDLLAFLAATVFCCMANEKYGTSIQNVPTIVGAMVHSSEQEEWWSAAYNVYTNRAQRRISKLRGILQRGLEAIRLVANHGVHISLMTHLAQCFTSWAKVARSDGSLLSEIEAIEDRAQHYWQQVLTHCQRLSRNQGVAIPRIRIFDYDGKELTEDAREKIIEEGKYFLAMRLASCGKYQEAVQILGELKSPESSYERAMLYKKQAQYIVGQKSIDKVDAEKKQQYSSLLTQARDTFYLTLDRLRMPSVDRFHPLNAKLKNQLAVVEKCLSNMTLDPDVSLADQDSESFSDNCPSPTTQDMTNGHISSLLPQQYSSTPYKFDTPSRTKRLEARPSPERLDTQIRHLTEMQENTLKHMEEQNSNLRTQNQALRDACNTMADQLKENTNIYCSILEQNKAVSQGCYNSILQELNKINGCIKNLTEQMKNVMTDVAEVKAITSTQKIDKEQPESEPVVADPQVPLDMSTSAVMTGLYSNYMGYYGQQALPSPLVAPSGIFGTSQPPFMPPSTITEQSYLPSSRGIQLGTQGTSLSTPSVDSTSATTSGFSSLTFQFKEATQHLQKSPESTVPVSTNTSWSLLSGPKMSSSQATAAPQVPHSFQITIPQSAPVTPSLSSHGAMYSANRFDESYSQLSTQEVPAAAEPVVVSPEKNTTSQSQNESTDHYVDDGHDPCPDFKPIIPLPEEVEVHTGEEEEEILFENRAKLFRFSSEKEWKERGTGVLKILHNSSKGSVRILMRRDQTHKICANHLIPSTLTLKQMKDNEKVWLWAAQDFADEEFKSEQFCCRFKTAEIAQEFKTGFEKAKEISKATELRAANQTSEPSIKNDMKTPEKQKSLLEMFKPAAGSWSCNSCLVVNKATDTECAACQTSNPNAPKSENTSTSANATSPFAGFKFGSSLTGNMIGNNSGFIFGVTSSTSSTGGFPNFSPPKFTGNFKFSASTPVATASSAAATATTTGLNLASTPVNTSNISFGISSSTTTTPVAFSASQKLAFSGFTFNTTPVFAATNDDKQEDKKQTQQEEETKKDAIFANLSFGVSSTATTTAAPVFNFTVPKTTEPEKPSVSGEGLFSNVNMGSAISFSSLTPASDQSNIFKIQDSKAFQAKPLFGAPAGDSPKGSVDKNKSDLEPEEYEPSVDFKPVIPLPDVVEVKTGEEEEESLFCDRAKLYRYNIETKEWKERGVGNIKILKNSETQKVRVLMRRDQTHKICANHYLTEDMKLGPMATSETAWVWAASDFADEEMKQEKFAVRFKTKEQADLFKKSFESAQEYVSNTKNEAPPSNTDNKKTETPSFGSQFKAPVGSWECSGCLVQNKADATECVCCKTKKPGTEVKPAASQAVSSTVSSFGDKFKPAAGSWECETCLVRNKPENNTCVSCGSGKDGTVQSKDTSGGTSSFSMGFSSKTLGFTFGVSDNEKSSFVFGIPASTATSNTTVQNSSSENEAKPTFIFGDTKTETKSSPFTWNASATTTTQDKPSVSFSIGTQESTFKTSENAGFKFGSPEKFEFSFSGVKPRSPHSREVSVCESEEEVVNDEGDDPYFEPVIPLPDKVDVVTGEEDEIEKYKQRAKLYRMIGGEWKERGIGDVKILYHSQQQKVRLLMRREQIHKICLNHYITKDVQFRYKDDKSIFWVATDFSENESVKETFAIRFKTPTIASEFVQAIYDAQLSLGANQETLLIPVQPPTPQKEEVTSSDDKSDKTNGKKPSVVRNLNEQMTSELEITYEAHATPEQVEKARKLMLPDNFYLYESKPPCPGCIGCDPDDVDLKTIKDLSNIKTCDGTTLIPANETTNISVSNTTSNTTSENLFANTPNIFNTSGTTLNLFGTPTGKSIFGGVQSSGSVFDKPSPFSFTPTESKNANVANTSSIFGNTTITLPKTDNSTSATFSFGSSTNNSSPSIFGGTGTQTIFGGSSNKLFSNDSKSNSTNTLDSNADKENIDKKESTLLFSSSNNVSFSDVVNQQSSNPIGSTQTSKNSDVWKAKPIFSNSSNKADDEDGDGECNNSHDPHFEPVIPLPDLVEVSTGEEGWDVKFCHRAKTFRFDLDAKQWKERGIGDFKILFNPETLKYRLLQRREQVHKLSINHYLSQQQEFNRMLSCDAAWCWGTADYSENLEGTFEKLAVKFKSKELADDFMKIIDDCKANMNTSINEVTNTSATVVLGNTVEQSGGDESDTAEEDYSEEDTIDDENGEESTILFSKQCQVSRKDGGEWKDLCDGNLTVKYDDDAYGASIIVTNEDDEIMAINLIAIQTELNCEGTTAFWSALDINNSTENVSYGYKATFESIEDINEFQSAFDEGKECASYSGIIEQPCGDLQPEQLYYGKGADD